MDASQWVVSLGGWVVSGFAIWRGGRVRVLDRRLEARKRVAELRVEVEHLVKQVQFAVQSRTNISAAIGMGGSGNLQYFRETAEADLAELRELRSAIETLKSVPAVPLIGLYARVEDCLVRAHGIGVSIQKLSDKYAAALAEDEAERTRIRDRQDRKTAKMLGY